MNPLHALVTAVALVAPCAAQDATRLASQMDSAMRAGQWEKVVTTSRALLEANPDHPQAWFNLGYSLHSTGKIEEALKAHEKASEFAQFGAIAAYNAACANALLGHSDLAFTWLDKAVKKGFNDVQQVQSDADLDSLRSDPRLAALVTRLGGKPATQAGNTRGAPPKVQVMGGANDRKSTRLFYWGGSSSPGQLMIDYGPIEWKNEYAGAIDAGDHLNKRWRLGGNFWTTLDTNLDLKVGGVDVPAGLYYLTLEQKEKGKVVLALNDPAKIRAKKLDAFQSESTSGGIEVPLTQTPAGPVAGKLVITLAVAPGGDPRDATLTIRFGPYQLQAPVETKLN